MSAGRMLTYVGGGSEKFWEVRQDGAELNIRHGRLGAAGREQVKSFGSAAAAAEAAGKLVAEKLRKGYTEDEAVHSPAAIDSAADEDRLTMPAAWLRVLHPRRGGAKVTVRRPAAAAPKELAARLEEHRKRIVESLARCQDPELASAGASYLAGEPTATPLGAAVVAEVVAAYLSWDDRKWLPLFAEGWMVERGLAFAAVAMAELASLDFDADEQTRPVRRLASGQSPRHWFGWNQMEPVTRVRAVLATAPDAEYAEVVAALAVSRAGGLHHRVVASYLAPTEADWVTADCAEVSHVNPQLAFGLVAAISTPEQAALIARHMEAYSITHSLALPATLVDGMGAEAVPVLAGWFDGFYHAESHQRLLGLLAELPTDAAMWALLDRIEQKYTQPAFLRAAARFPRRAMRLLAASGGKVADLLLRAHVLAHPGLVAEVLASADDAAAERINKIATAETVPAAPPESLPEVLVSPPWTRPRKPREPVVVSDLVCADEPAVVWGPGERDNGRSARPGYDSWDRARHQNWRKIAGQIAGGRHGDWYDEAVLFVSGPEELARPLIGKWRPADHWGASEWLPKVVARFEVAALPLALDCARRNPGAIAPALLPFAGPEVAVLMAEWLSRLKSVRATALAWLDRHPEAAARALIPPALGTPGPARRQAERALASLVAGGGRD
ncbi:WGR domain-containing protein, partial [Nonomuraea insulae]